MTSVFGNDLNSAKIKTYFNRSTKSKYRVNFDRPGELYYDWISYCRSTGKTRSGYKYLLLTEDGHDDDGEDVDGVAGMGGKYAWAEVDAKQHTTAGHEIGHNLTLDHSDSGLMNDKSTFGNKNVTKDEKGEIVSGQINPKDGNGVYKDSQLNLSGHYKKPIKSQVKDFMKKHTNK